MRGGRLTHIRTWVDVDKADEAVAAERSQFGSALVPGAAAYLSARNRDRRGVRCGLPASAGEALFFWAEGVKTASSYSIPCAIDAWIVSDPTGRSSHHPREASPSMESAGPRRCRRRRRPRSCRWRTSRRRRATAAPPAAAPAAVSSRRSRVRAWRRAARTAPSAAPASTHPARAAPARTGLTRRAARSPRRPC